VALGLAGLVLGALLVASVRGPLVAALWVACSVAAVVLLRFGLTGRWR
jgi:hypothetical protein